MKAVELIDDHDCPNIEQARTHLLHAFSEAGIPPEWVEWDRGDRAPSKVAKSKPPGWRTSLAVLPEIGASLLPVGVCLACWPAYAGLLSSLGFGFLLETAYILPLTSLFLVIAVAALAYKARARRGYRPFVLGLAASPIVLVGKFIFESDTAMYIGKGTRTACVSRGKGVGIEATGGTTQKWRRY